MSLEAEGRYLVWFQGKVENKIKTLIPPVRLIFIQIKTTLSIGVPTL